MRTIFETCEPRAEVLKGELREEIFAARLKDVIEDRADPVYQDPATFFDNTYPTSGLKHLLNEALGRLTGVKPTSSSTIRLETAFGGGKTHNLIALYHLARGGVDHSIVASLVAPDLLPKEGDVLIAGAVGSELAPADGLDHGDVATYTLWGEIAYQLGGVEAYQLVKASDRSRTAAGPQPFERIVGDRPTLIMVDELARYLRVAKGMVGETSLADQTVAFLLSLLEFAANREQVVVIITLADVKDAFGRETEELVQALAEAASVSARREHIIRPTEETEIPTIVTHRLFRSIDRETAKETAEGYSTYLSRLIEQGVDLPHSAGSAEYAQEIISNYPFHPELLTVLHRKTSTIPNFQKTRGALRLLARVVRQLWKDRPSEAYLIHPHHLDLGNDDIANELTSRLGRPDYQQVIEADIVSPREGTPSHAQTIDRTWLEAGKSPHAYRAATTIFLHSLTQVGALGVDPGELMLAVVQPGDEPQLVTKALQRLYGEDKEFPAMGTACWFLEWDGHRWRFKTEPSLHKIIADEMQFVGRVKAKEELDNRIQQIWRKGVFQPVYFPSEAGEVDDDAKEPKMVIVHYDAATSEASATQPAELVLKIFEHAGSLEGYRTYKNNLLFLVADKDQVDRMVEVAQKYLAIHRIVGDPERLREFPEEQRKKLKNMQEASELDVRVAITKGYRYLYYPSADVPRSTGNLARETLPAQDQGDVEKDQTAVLLRVLKQLDKVQTADDKGLPAAFVKAKAWPAEREYVATDDLRKAFAQRLGLKILLDVNQLKRTIKDGIGRGDWIYYVAEEQAGYGKDSPSPLIQLGEDTELYTLEEAKKRGIRIKGEEVTPKVCPVCGKPANECICGKVCPRCGQDPCICEKTLRINAEGAPAQVFQAVLDQCHDSKVEKLRGLSISTEGTGREGASDARLMGLAIPQLGKGQYRVEQTMGAEFGTEETFSLNFSGSWDRYKRVKQLTDSFGQEASKVSVKTVLRADFPEGLSVDSDQLETMRDVFTSLGMGRLVVDAETGEGESS